MNIYAKIWNKETNTLFDFDSFDYQINKFKINSPGYIVKDDITKKVLYRSLLLERANYLSTVKYEGNGKNYNDYILFGFYNNMTYSFII